MTGIVDQVLEEIIFVKIESHERGKPNPSAWHPRDYDWFAPHMVMQRFNSTEEDLRMIEEQKRSGGLVEI